VNLELQFYRFYLEWKNFGKNELKRKFLPDGLCVMEIELKENCSLHFDSVSWGDGFF
jgi:hypothetical protein